MTARDDFDRAVDRTVIWQEAATIAERHLDRAVLDAAWLLAPRVKLVDE